MKYFYLLKIKDKNYNITIMKVILLAKMSKRVLAALIDFVILLALTFIIFFPCGVYNAVLDDEKYNDNVSILMDNYIKTGLYVEINKAVYSISSLANEDNFKSFEDFNEFEVKVQNDETNKEEIITFNFTDSIVRYYLEKRQEANGDDVRYTNYSLDYIKKNILNIASSEEKSTNNIKSLELNEENKYYITGFDEKTSSKVQLTLDLYQNLFTNLESEISNSPINASLLQENNMIIGITLVYLLPISFGLAFIFYFLIPLFSKNGETIGKYIFKIGVISDDGYSLKKYKYLIRFLSFYIVEILGSIATFGGMFLISYVTYVFSKKKKSIHDFISKSVVIDKVNSVWFKSKEDEEIYAESHKDYDPNEQILEN